MLDQLMEFIKSQIAQNDLFKGGLLLMVGGAALASLRSYPLRIWDFIKRQSMVVIDIPDKDPAFEWVNLWLANHEYSKNRARLLTVKTERNEHRVNMPKIIFSPAPGTHILWYKRRLMILERERQRLGQGSQGSVSDPFRECFTIKILGRCRNTATKLIQESHALACPESENRFTVHRSTAYAEWLVSSKVANRPLDSVILPKGMRENLIDDVQTFLDSEEWYVSRGLPYRRGYLFYGPPGNGKTSIITSLASHFELDISVLNIKIRKMDDQVLTELLSDVPPNSIILIEDIDCVVAGRETDSGISFSGLLNALDGVTSSHGQLVIMTTNHRDKLDEALIRPGRCDVQLMFPNASTDQARRMFEKFFPGSDLAYAFSKLVPKNTSMASLQGHVMTYRESPEEALNNIAKDSNE